jgi:hypothetical protein
MKKFLRLFAIIALLMTSCQKEEVIEVIPITQTPTPTVETNSGGSNKFYLSFHTNNRLSFNNSILMHTDIEPVFSIDGISLDYYFKSETNWQVEDIINITYEYDIPNNLDISCDSLIDISISFDNDSMVGVKIYDMQIYHVKTRLMARIPYGYDNTLIVETQEINPYVIDFTDITVLCD